MNKLPIGIPTQFSENKSALIYIKSLESFNNSNDEKPLLDLLNQTSTNSQFINLFLSNLQIELTNSIQQQQQPQHQLQQKNNHSKKI
ncbi:hypothetical protein DLAC_01743 [Tieghemostelium lacteum]|uniref:Uncharacterized protein n=1 Tax=Tieghemostelium lacteum TaxID=361077 RepID=A0A152A678_TIELA|nr:hypothetical protein DLAC_01743 [Tieghemostelium lacteum]|eukprot:KYR01732.1 hypothetical protein DLAC_01743 [Tieghemostelium lacteum]